MMRIANDNRPSPLPNGVAPRGLNRLATAAYIGIGATLFYRLVGEAKMPKPYVAGGRTIWDRFELDDCFCGLARADCQFRDTSQNPWDVALAS